MKCGTMIYNGPNEGQPNHKESSGNRTCWNHDMINS